MICKIGLTFTMKSKLEFKQVPVESLVINKKYKFVYEHCDVCLYATLTSMEDLLIFKKITYIVKAEIDCISYYNHYMIYKHNLSRIQFYIPMNKELAQQSMEKRALNKIIQRVLRDPHFEWF